MRLRHRSVLSASGADVKRSSVVARCSVHRRTRLTVHVFSLSSALLFATRMYDLHKAALRSAVIVAIGPALAPHLQWTASGLPMVSNVQTVLGGVIRRFCADPSTLLRDSSAASSLQRARGNWEPVLAGGQTPERQLQQKPCQPLSRLISFLSAPPKAPALGLGATGARYSPGLPGGRPFTAYCRWTVKPCRPWFLSL